jgi:hypothetical protein
MPLVCSQTSNGCDAMGCLTKPSLFEYKVVSGVILVSRRTDAGCTDHDVKVSNSPLIRTHKRRG